MAPRTLPRMAEDGVIGALEQIVVHGGTVTNRALAEVHPEIRDLSVSQYRILALVASAGSGLRVSELARRAMTSPQATTRLVQRLAAKGFVHSVRGALADRRAVVVETTERGARAWAEISARRRELLGQALDGLDLPAVSGSILADIELALEAFVRAGGPDELPERVDG
jgi:DNA-binding MarR family transcriptional regulator